MVSTRGVRYKFSEGERVLCYEPDPTKAKVLYDSKVLEVIESKDKRGRRTVEYLIHFQGWNSSWDRCVSEDFVLKDTEENRQLQRDLAEKSQLQLGAYLYRRERKKGSTSSAGAAPAKRGRQGFSDDGSSSSTQPDEGTTEGEAEPEVEAEGERKAEGERVAEVEGEADGEGEAEEESQAEEDGEAESEGEPDDEGEAEGEGEAAGEGEASPDTDSSSASAGSGSQPNSPPHNMQAGRANITLPSALRDRLTFDYHLVVKRGRLSRLPAVPCAAFILESFVKWFVRAGAWSTPRGRHDTPQPRPDLLDVACRLNLVREVADGLRVYFDFILRGHLLYKQELNQYHEICGQFIEQQEKQCKEEYDDDQSQDESSDAEEDMKSPKIPEYSHLPPDPAPKDKQMAAENSETHDEEMKEIKQEIKDDDEPDDEPHQDTKPDIVKEEEKSPKDEPKSEIKEEIKDEDEEKPTPTEEDPHSFANEVRRETRPATRSGNLARRLRSHKSIVSQSENEEHMPSTSGTSAGEPKVFETMSSSVGSSGSSMSEGWALSGGTAPPTQAAPAPTPATSTRTPLSLLLEKVAKWQIIPREGTEHLPCRVYGAIHLARLFVKLPDFLNATQMPDMKLKLIVKHIDMFVQYLDEHSEWFGETYYVADNLSRCT